MALPTLHRKLFRNDGYGPLLRSEIIPFTLDLASKAADAVASTEWVKELADAEVYVDASVSSSGDGFTAITAVKTINEGIAILQSLPLSGETKIRLHVAGGTYNEDIIIRNIQGELIFDGNVLVNGYISIENKCLIVFSSTNNSTFTITKTGFVALNIESHSKVSFNCNVILNGSSSDIVFSLYYQSICTFNNNLIVNCTNITGKALQVGGSSWLTCDGSTTVSGSVLHCLSCFDNGIVRFSGNLDFTCSGISFELVNHALVFVYSPTISVTSNGCVWCENTSTICFYSFTSFTVNRTASQTIFSSSRFGNILINSSKSGATLSINAGSGTGDIFRVYDDGIMLIASLPKLVFSGSCSVNADCYSRGYFWLNLGTNVSGSLTGKRYNAASYGYVNTAGGGANRLPGNTAGTVDSPGFGLYR